MASAEYNFDIEQGASFKKSFVWKDSNKVPVPLTGCQVRMEVRQSASSDEVLLSASTEGSAARFVLGTSPGEFSLVIPAYITKDIGWRKGKYDIEVVSRDGEVTRLLHGTIEVSREITREATENQP